MRRRSFLGLSSLMAATALTSAGVDAAKISPDSAAPAGKSKSLGPAHAFDFVAIDGGPLPMADFAGKAVLLVNTASRCGFTYQYEALQSLWSDYRDRGLVVLGVPSNDFGRQEPGSNAEIKQFCEASFSIDFPMTEKQSVKGPNAHPMYRWLNAELGPKGRPSWNFHKFLITPGGEIAGVWSARTEPSDETLLAAIEGVLPH